MIDEKKLLEKIDNNVPDLTSDQIYKIAEVIVKQPKLNAWIPCSERLPEETDYPEQRFRVLASCSDGIVRNATIKSLRNTEEEHRSRGNFFTYVAWQPLPEPYRE